MDCEIISQQIAYIIVKINDYSTLILIILIFTAVYFEQKEYSKCIDQCEKAVEVGRENRADFKLIAKAFSRIGNAYKKLEVGILRFLFFFTYLNFVFIFIYIGL